MSEAAPRTNKIAKVTVPLMVMSITLATTNTETYVEHNNITYEYDTSYAIDDWNLAVDQYQGNQGLESKSEDPEQLSDKISAIGTVCLDGHNGKRNEETGIRNELCVVFVDPMIEMESDDKATVYLHYGSKDRSFYDWVKRGYKKCKRAAKAATMMIDEELETIDTEVEITAVATGGDTDCLKNIDHLIG